MKMLLEAKKSGTNFSNTVMIGRQKINLSKRENSKLEKFIDVEIKNGTINFDNRSYADSLLKEYLDIKKLNIVDYSDYEGANISLDLNYPIKKIFYNKYDVLIDGGSIEHIFNFPVAIKNYMNLIKVNGEIFIFTNANNHCGHGFYQFSPELFYRVFNKSNGFKIKSVILLEHPYPGAELSEKHICYKVNDPETIGRRALIVNKSPLGILVNAIKTKEVKIFEIQPLQSDYKNTWVKNKKIKKEKMNSIFNTIIKLLPKRLMNKLRGIKQLYNSSLKNDKAFFKRL